MKHPEEEQRDVFAHLDRFSLDSIQFGCRRFRGVVVTLMPTVCLRALQTVEIHPGVDATDERRYLDVFGGRCVSAAKLKKGYIVAWSFKRPIDIPGALIGLEVAERSVLFPNEEEAGQYLLALIQSSTIGKLTLGRFMPDAEFLQVRRFYR